MQARPDRRPPLPPACAPRGTLSGIRSNVMKKLLVCIACAGLWIASAKGPKGYSVTFPEKALIGSTQLDPGQYKLKVEGSLAVFYNVSAKKVAEAPVTVSTADRKFTETEVVSSNAAGSARKIDAIELQGTKLKLQFGN
jgi:hypothetical protein